MAAHFGLDIGTYSIKLIQAEGKGKNYRLHCRGEARTPAPISSEAEKDQTALGEAIKKLASDARVSTRNVVLSLPETDVFTQIIELPYLSKTELSAALKYEAEQYIPVPLNEVQLEHIVLKVPSKGSIDEKMEVLLVAAKKTSLDKMISVVEKAGLTPISVETEILSQIRTLNLDPSSSQFILDLGHRSTNMLLVSKTKIKFVRTLNTGGEAITRSIARSLNMDANQAEQYKVNYGLDNSHLEGKVAKAVLPAFNVVIEEVKRGLAFFSQKHAEERVTTVILSGGGAEMPGLFSYVAQALGIEVLIADPFANFIKDNQTQNVPGRPRFTVATGLAIRENG
jgi:type IV pilus assembly protein PilM